MLVRVIGPLRAERTDGTEVALRPMERRLVAALVALRPHRVSMDAIADALWPAGPPRTARKTIQTNVLRVRNALGESVIRTEADGYGLGPGVGVDIDDLRLDSPESDRTTLNAAAAASVLDEVAEWAPAQPVRAWIQELCREAERRRLEALVERCDGSVVADCESYVMAWPLDEDGWCLLVRALRDSGRCAEALRAWERARSTLVEELGASPGPSLSDLYRSLLDDDARHVVRVDFRDDRVARAESVLSRSGSGWQTGLDATDAVVVDLEASLAEVPRGPTPLRARLLARWAVVRSHSAPMSQCIAAARTAMVTAEALDSPELLAEAANALAVVLADPAADAERRRWAELLIKLADAHGRLDWRAWAMPVLARSDCLAGRFDDAASRLGGIDGPEGTLMIASLRGDWAAGRRAAAELREQQSRRLFDPNAAKLQERGILGILSLHEGSAIVDAGLLLEWPSDMMSWSVQAWAAAALARSGDVGRAGALLDGLDPAALAGLEHDGYFLPLHALLADAAHIAARPDVADVVANEIEPLIGSTIVDPGLLYRGAVSHTAGLAAATCGRNVRARELLRSAAETHRDHGSVWMLDRSLAALNHRPR